MDSDSYTGSSHWYTPTTIKGFRWLMLIHHFWPGPFSTVAFFTGQSWCLVAVCISDKKPCGVPFMGFLLLESTLSCIYLLIFSSWECSSFVLQRKQESNCQHLLDHRKSERVPEKHLFLPYWLCQSLCVDHNKLWKILKEMGIPDHLTCLLRNLYAGQLELDMEQQTGSK